MKFVTFLIHIPLFFFAAAAQTAGAVCRPHGCDWIPEETTVTDITFTRSLGNTTCQGVEWQYLWSNLDPRTCAASVSQFIGSQNRIACVEAHPTRNDTFWPGRFTIVDAADDGSSIDVDFSL